jgi:enoyl-CoA hydratase
MVSLAVAARRATVTLDRPPVNAWDDDAVDALERIIVDLDGRDDVDLVVVRSSGRHFSAGGDIKQMTAALDRDDFKSLNTFATRIQSLFLAWSLLDLPTVAVLRGAVTGGGLEFALACDLRIAASDAQMGLPECKLGLLPAGGGTQLLTRAVGRGRAMRLMLTGELIDGARAEAIGLVEWCVPEEDLDKTVEDVVALLASHASPAQRAVKRCVSLAGTPWGFGAETMGQRRLHSDPYTRRRLKNFVSDERST